MAASVRKKISQRISQSGWMDQSTKQTAMDKLYSIKRNIGFDDFDIKKSTVIRYYKGLKLTEDYEQNILNWIEWMRAKDVERSKKAISIDRSIQPIAINALYRIDLNAVYISPWMIKFSAIGPDVPESISLGTLGAVIGHEISHAFDSTGIKYNRFGYHANWPQDVKKNYDEKSQCYIDQYNNYAIPELSSTKPVYVNGRKTVDENIADGEGLIASFAVLRDSMKKKGFKDRRLPGLENLTAEQLFFLSFGNMWCTQRTNSSLTLWNEIAGHTAKHVRVNGAISNSAEFDKAFNCPVGSKMNPATKCDIWN